MIHAKTKMNQHTISYRQIPIMCLLICRCTTRSWRVSMATLKTGSTLSTCTEERPGTTTNTLWMTTGLLVDSRWENT